MAFGGFGSGGGQQPLAEINMIPLIDVMLVLLVIFIVTAPLLTHAVKIELPHASSAPAVTKPENIQLAINAQGRVFWNSQAVSETDWRTRMSEAAARQPQPELQLRADGAVAYRHVASLMSDAARAGLTKIGFVTDPAPAQ